MRLFGRKASVPDGTEPIPGADAGLSQGMTSQQHLRKALAETVVPLLRSRGYRGTNPTWRLTSARGDVAVVNVQSSSMSTSAEVHCIINLAVAPEPYLAWGDSRRPKPGGAVREYDGLVRARLATSSPEAGWWRVSDPRSATVAALDMADRLQDDGLDMLESLLNRAVMLDGLRRADLGEWDGPAGPLPFAWAQAVLLADEGSSKELNTLVRQLRALKLTNQAETHRQLLAWVADRTALRDEERSSAG